MYSDFSKQVWSLGCLIFFNFASGVLTENTTTHHKISGISKSHPIGFSVASCESATWNVLLFLLIIVCVMQKKIYDSTEFITEPILHRTLFTSNSPVLISYTAVLISHSTLFILQIVSLWYWKDTKCFSNQIKNSPRIKLFSALVYNSGYNSEFTKFCEWRIND